MRNGNTKNTNSKRKWVNNDKMSEREYVRFVILLSCECHKKIVCGMLSDVREMYS